MKIHVVKKGDTLYLLSKKYNVELDKIIAANPQLSDPNKIDVGMKIKIPSGSMPVHTPHNIAFKHKVKQGDSLFKIAKAFGVPLADMIKANIHLKNPNVLMTGDVVFVPDMNNPGTGTAGTTSALGMDKVPGAAPVEAVDNLVPPTPIAPEPAAKEDNDAPLLNEMEPASANIVESLSETKTNTNILPEVTLPNPNPTLPIVEAAAEQIPETKPEQKPDIKDLTNIKFENSMSMGSPSTDLFAQFNVPATEVASYYMMPGLPTEGEVQGAFQAPTATAPTSYYPTPYQGYLAPMTPAGGDCGCGCGGGSKVKKAYMANLPYPPTVAGASYANSPYPGVVAGAQYANPAYPIYPMPYARTDYVYPSYVNTYSYPQVYANPYQFQPLPTIEEPQNVEVAQAVETRTDENEVKPVKPARKKQSLKAAISQMQKSQPRRPQIRKRPNYPWLNV